MVWVELDGAQMNKRRKVLKKKRETREYPVLVLL